MKARVISAEVSEDGQRGTIVLRLGPDNGGSRIGLNGPASVVERMGVAGFIGAEVDLEFRLTLNGAYAVFS